MNSVSWQYLRKVLRKVLFHVVTADTQCFGTKQTAQWFSHAGTWATGMPAAFMFSCAGTTEEAMPSVRDFSRAVCTNI